jgi:hypothetical protein
VPPNGRESMIATFQPADRHSNATFVPAVPVPTTIKSKFFI